MALHLVLLVVGLILLTAGAEGLVRGGASLARRLGLTPLVVGLTVVAFGTSMPELVVSLSSALRGVGDISLGNVVGSNIFNVGVILGLSAVVSPIRIQLGLIKLDMPVLIGISLLALGLALSGSVSRGAGVVLVLLLIAYTAFNIRLARKQTAAAVAQEFEEGVPGPTASWLWDLLFILGGLGLLIYGSNLLVNSAIALARAFGVSEAVIGLTLVAAGTSMPELATSIVAALRRQSDIAVGNVVGSNIFNILGILGVTAMVRPVLAPGISRLDLGVMVAYAVVLLPLLWSGQRLDRREGLLLVGGYLAYLWVLWPGT
ncbi:calcium/sodium antiporter [Litorilinea aerophila]|uniref:Calcium/sodium antiporter n=1 Tax=Litorilinea aerophila TaxID=1204385 RepID=A0A540VIZ3_9CHLR|nr:calcium/sodium antiporter [Litorilinea aerophila]MCC9075604.1 calcium/sodium antiporter [Litorilinea aerophila]